MSSVKIANIIKRLPQPVCTQFTISMITSSIYYVFDDTRIDTLADELSNNDAVYALCVVDESMQVKGVIVRKDLFDILGRRFGRELYYNRTVVELAQQVTVFYYNMHVFECSRLIRQDLERGIQNHYALVDENGCFKGLFSTKDMLIFLSRLTQIDIEHAKSVINRLLKKEFALKTKRLSIAIKNEMVQDIGGDSYFVIPLKTKNQIILGVCDVAGKGISASMITAIISGMVTTYDFENNPLESFLLKLNNYIYSTFEGEKFVTACFMIIDEESSLLLLYDFGHSMTYLYRDNVFKLSLKEMHVPMGIQRIDTVQSGKFKLEPGDCIYILTDGCIEQRDHNCKDYGIQRFNKIFVNNYSDDLMKTLNAIMMDIKIFRGSYPQQDDMTVACIRYE